MEIWNIVGAVIASVGGVGVIICAVAAFTSNRIAKHIDYTYEKRLNKELEEQKLIMDNKRYVTKAQFDREFEIYNNLSLAFHEMIVKLCAVPGIDEEKDNIYPAEVTVNTNTIKNVIEKTAKGQDILFANEAFIPADIFDCYKAVMDDAYILFWKYADAAEEKLGNGEKLCIQITKDDMNVQKSVKEKYHVLNKQLRNYLSKLAIIE